YSTQDILEMFYDNNKYFIDKEGNFSVQLVPARLRGQVLNFEIKSKKAVIVKAGVRITARHIREMEKAELTTLEVPAEFIIGNALAKDIVDKDTGEVKYGC